MKLSIQNEHLSITLTIFKVLWKKDDEKVLRTIKKSLLEIKQTRLLVYWALIFNYFSFVRIHAYFADFKIQDWWFKKHDYWKRKSGSSRLLWEYLNWSIWWTFLSKPVDTGPFKFPSFCRYYQMFSRQTVPFNHCPR